MLSQFICKNIKYLGCFNLQAVVAHSASCFFYIPPLHWLNVIHVISDLTVCYLWIPCSARGLCTFWSIDFWTVKLFPPNFTGLQRQNYKECVIVLKHVGLTVRATGRDECSPYLRFFRYGYGSVKRSQKIGIPQNINYCRWRNRSIFTKERKAGVESYVPSSLSKEPLFETKLDWKLRWHSSNKMCRPYSHVLHHHSPALT